MGIPLDADDDARDTPFVPFVPFVPFAPLALLLVLWWAVWFDGMVRDDNGVPDRPLGYTMDVVRWCWPGRCELPLRAACSDRDVDADSDCDKISPADAFWRGNPGIACADLRMLDDDSEIGGDGGVAVADDASDALAGGVVKSGDEMLDIVAAGDRSYRSYSSGV